MRHAVLPGRWTRIPVRRFIRHVEHDEEETDVQGPQLPEVQWFESFGAGMPELPEDVTIVGEQTTVFVQVVLENTQGLWFLDPFTGHRRCFGVPNGVVECEIRADDDEGEVPDHTHALSDLPR